MLKMLKSIANFFLHILAICLIVYSFFPIAKWYFYSVPLWGVDFFYTASLVNIIKENQTILPPLAWNFAWFSGSPILVNFPIFHFYLILLTTFVIDLFTSIKVVMIVSTIFSFLGFYFLFYVLSKNKIISLILVISTIYSIGTYGALMWGGGLPSYGSQAFVPWVLYFIILHRKKYEFKYLLGACLLSGLAILSHPQIVLTYIFPAAVIFYTFATRIKLSTRFKYLIFFIGISLLIGSPILYQNSEAFKYLFLTNRHIEAASTTKVPTAIEAEIKAFNRLQPLRALTDVQANVFVILIFSVMVFVIFMIFGRIKISLLNIIPFIIVILWFFIYLMMFAYGISIYHGGWYRLFWSVPLWLGMLAAYLWGRVESVAHKLIKIILNTVIIVISYFLFFNVRPDIVALYINPKTFGNNYFSVFKNESIAPGTFSLLVTRSQSSSAYPDVVNLKTDQKKINELKKQLIPNWLDPQNTNYRLYDADQIVNIWWSAFYKLPLARGYFDSLYRKTRDYMFWMDAALNIDNKTGEHQLVGSFGYPEEIAKNNTFFLIDWYSLKYFEAGHSGSAAYSPLPVFLTDNDYMKNSEKLNFNNERYSRDNRELQFYEIKDEFVSPILMATNAPTLGIIASVEGYETVVRAISDIGLTSDKVIPINLGRYIENIDSKTLSNLDSLFLYDYSYKNREVAFKKLSQYVEGGRTIFIDTGVETKDSESTEKTLPDLLPIKTSERKAQGTSWSFKVYESQITKGINFEKFDPPIFDSVGWKLSYPKNKTDLREKSNIILENYGYPIMVSQKIGNGEVIWSGMNLAYHVIRYHNSDEVAFFKNIILGLLPHKFSSHPEFKAEFISPIQRKITTNKASGVLFKEHAFSGWEAEVNSQGKTITADILKAGPSYPGFMYVPLDLKGDSIEVRFIYKGEKASWLFFSISIILIFLIFESFVFGGILIGRNLLKLHRKTLFFLRSWWVREDE